MVSKRKIRFDIDTIDDLEAEIERAVLTDKAMPPVASLNAKSTWPDFIRSPKELSVIIKDAPKFTPLQEDIDKWEHVCFEWAKACEPEEWAIIWLKACKLPGKVMEQKMKMSRTKIWYFYEKSIRKLFLKVTGNKLPAMKKEKKERIRGFTTELITIKEAIERLENKIKNKY